MDNQRCIVLPVETDDTLSIRGVLGEKYVRVQIGRNNFFIPGNRLKEAFFSLKNNSMKIGDRKNDDPVSFQRIEDDADGEKRIRFTVRMNSGDIKHITLPQYVMAEIAERIDQAKALLWSYQGIEEVSSSPSVTPDVSQETGSATVATAAN